MAFGEETGYGEAARVRTLRYTAAVDTTGLPGADLIERGLSDLAAGRESAEALLVLVGAPRLRQLGFAVSEPPTAWLAPSEDPSPEHRLYALLANADPDSAHSRYNALIRMLVSFERAGASGRVQVNVELASPAHFELHEAERLIQSMPTFSIWRSTDC